MADDAEIKTPPGSPRGKNAGPSRRFSSLINRGLNIEKIVFRINVRAFSIESHAYEIHLRCWVVESPFLLICFAPGFIRGELGKFHVHMLSEEGHAPGPPAVLRQGESPCAEPLSRG